jgi:TolA-binding protein
MSSNTVANVTNLFKWLVVLLVCSMLWTGVNGLASGNFSLFGPSKTDMAATIKSQEETIKRLNENIKKLEKDIKLQEDIRKISEDTVSDNVDKEKDIKKKTDVQKTKVKKKIEEIAKDPTLSEEAKDKETSAVLFDSLEEARCSHVSQSCYKVST